MRSEVQFAMDPEDEIEFITEVLSDPSVVLVDGPRWKTKKPPTTRDISKLSDDYCIIWSREDLPQLDAEYIPTCKDWYCRSEFATIQFLRSVMHKDSVLINGRIAICTTDDRKQYIDAQSGKQVDTRYCLASVGNGNPRSCGLE